jgi:hypothetical protein
MTSHPKRTLPRHLLQFLLPPCIDDLPVELQLPHIHALRALDVVEALGTRKITVQREVPWYGAFQRIIDQLETQRRMVFAYPCCTDGASLKPALLNGVVCSRGTYVVRDQIIMRDHVPLANIVPELPYVFAQLALMCHQRIINSNASTHAVPRLRRLL